MSVFSVWDVKGVRVPKPNERVLKIVMSPEITGTRELTLLASIIPSKSTTGSHIHDSDEVIYIAHGRGELIFKGERTPVQADQVVFAPKGITHEIRNTGEETVKLICVFYPPLKAEGYVKEATEAALGK